MKKDKAYTIYLVDDDSMYRNTLEYTLKDNLESKLTLKTFSTGEDCLKEIYESNPPDIVVLDYHLNSVSKHAMNGIKILGMLKSFNENIQVIMLSSQEKMDIAVNSVRYGAFDYVIKNESAFVRVRKIVDNIIYNIDLKRNVKTYQSWNLVAGILFLIFLSTIIISNILKHV
jgi:two-component system OmpR family response regulator